MATWRLRRTDRLRNEIDRHGCPFDMAEYDRSEALRRGLGLSWKHSLLFSMGVPLLILGTLIFWGYAILSLTGILD